MKREVQLRVIEAAKYILKSGATVRKCAEAFGVSKTTIHKDMRGRLPELSENMARMVDAVLNKNKEERHIRGGQATKEKYLKKK